MSDTPFEDRPLDEPGDPVEPVDEMRTPPPSDEEAGELGHASESGGDAAPMEELIEDGWSPLYERPVPGEPVLADIVTPEAEAAAERMIAHARAEAQARAAFADLTLWEVLLRGLRAPRSTWQAFWAVVNDDESWSTTGPKTSLAVDEPPPVKDAADQAEAGSALFVDEFLLFDQLPARASQVPVGLMILGFIIALVGGSVMRSGINRDELHQLNAGAPWLIIGFGMWLVAGVMIYQQDLLAWPQAWHDWLGHRRLHSAVDEGAVLDPQNKGPGLPAFGLMGLLETLETHSARLALGALGVVLCLATYAFNAGNTFTGFGVFVWISSIVVWLAVLTPSSFDLIAWVDRWQARWGRPFRQGVNVRLSWTVAALVVIMLVAGYFRFAQFAEVPPDMTSDHVEKLLDAQRILDGTPQIFFPNNGGREGLQMYLVAFFSQISGLGMQFITLKWVSVLEGLLTIPVLWWMGREIIGDRQPRLGNTVGLLLAALVAISYWHVALSRLALRIVLTPLVMALVMVYLTRAMRHNRRSDFLKAGLVLGIGLYCYQAVRMIPVVIVLGVGLAFVFRAQDWMERRRYAGNLAVLVVIALVIFIPLGRFMIESPNHFWMRTAGRILGDDIITELDPDTGSLVERDATLQDRIDAFSANLPVLGNNIRNVLLMFNWKGDVAWINGAPLEPAMDAITGTFLILGLAAWLVRMFRRRDMVDWLVLPAIFIMLLPSALSIAFPVENPSATRTSGALPLVYLLAAYALALLLRQVEIAFRHRRIPFLSVGIAAALLLGAYSDNSSLYFGRYVDRYRMAAQPYSVAGRILRDFAEGYGSYGNAFMIAYDYWFDHRAIGIEGGRIDWPNGLFSIYDWPDFVRESIGTDYAFDPDRAVLFYYNQEDEETARVLHDWFPNGSSTLQATGNEFKDFYTFTALPPGEDWLVRFLAEHPPTD